MTDQSMAIIKQTLNSTEIMKRFASFMGESDAKYYINSVILAVANSKDLQECTPQSIVFSALRAASLRLSCDPALGEAYLIPFNNNKKNTKEAAFIPGYKGLRNLCTRTNKYRYINAGKLRNGQQWHEDDLTGKCTILGKAIDNTTQGWFAFFEMFNGYSKGLYMTIEQIHDHAKQYSKTYSNPKSKWQSRDRLEVEAMEKKTVLRLLINRWGDMGEAGNAFRQEEILDADEFGIDVRDIPEDEEPKPRQSVAQNMTDLGFDVDEPEVQPEPDEPPMPEEPAQPADAAPMPLETAENVTSGKDGTRYGDTPTDELANKLIGLNKMIKNPATTQEKREEAEYKRDAVNVILAARSKA